MSSNDITPEDKPEAPQKAPDVSTMSDAQPGSEPALPPVRELRIAEPSVTAFEEARERPASPGLEAALQSSHDAMVEARIRQLSRRSFLWGALGIAATGIGMKWIDHQRQIDGVAWPFRLALQANENLARDYFKEARLAPTFARAQAQEPKQNGTYGLDDDVDMETWRLHVIGLPDTAAAATDDANTEDAGLKLTMQDIRKLPRVEMVTQLKCIEGWSVIVHWAGARFADLVAQHAPHQTAEQMPAYVGMETPDGQYYVGLDKESALHPQTLLCYEMNGEPLTPEHGAPLRLVIPVKYGIKNIKRIGTIHFTDTRPKDYWAEQGYDWYAGH